MLEKIALVVFIILALIIYGNGMRSFIEFISDEKEEDK